MEGKAVMSLDDDDDDIRFSTVKIKLEYSQLT